MNFFMKRLGEIKYFIYFCHQYYSDKMTTIRLSTNNLSYVELFENLARVLNVSYEKKEKDAKLSKSMQKALDDEDKGRITKLSDHKNAVAEILG